MAEVTIEIHPSEVNAGLLCPKRLDENLKEKAPSYDLIRGTVTHELIAADLQGIPGDASLIFWQRLESEYSMFPEDFPYPDKATRLMEEAEFAYRCWDSQVKPQLHLTGVISIEDEYRTVLATQIGYGDDLVTIELVGTPDLIDARSAIHDWKTARKMWELNKPPSQVQPPLYAYLAGGQSMPFTFWVFDFGIGTWGALPIVPTENQMDAAVEEAVRLAMCKYFGFLPANPGVPPAYKSQTRNWWCSPKYCDSWNKCSARHLVNDGNDDNVRDWRTDWQS